MTILKLSVMGDLDRITRQKKYERQNARKQKAGGFGLINQLMSSGHCMALPERVRASVNDEWWPAKVSDHAPIRPRISAPAASEASANSIA